MSKIYAFQYNVTTFSHSLPLNYLFFATINKAFLTCPFIKNVKIAYALDFCPYACSSSKRFDRKRILLLYLLQIPAVDPSSRIFSVNLQHTKIYLQFG